MCGNKITQRIFCIFHSVVFTLFLFFRFVMYSHILHFFFIYFLFYFFLVVILVAMVPLLLLLMCRLLVSYLLLLLEQKKNQYNPIQPYKIPLFTFAYDVQNFQWICFSFLLSSYLAAKCASSYATK